MWVFILFPAFHFTQDVHFLRLSVEDFAEAGRITFESSLRLHTDIEKEGSFITVMVRADVPFRIQRNAFRSRFIDSIRWSSGSDYYIFSIKVRQAEFSYISSTLSDPPRLVIDVLPKQQGELRVEPEGSQETYQGEAPEREEEEASRPPVKPGSAGRGMRTIVVDPGHGGLEPGARGKFGAQEKDLTLGISLKLKSMIERELAYPVELTRSEDVDRSLEDRAAIANNHHAFVFVSIHTNSSARKQTRGPEVYFLNLNATDEEARRLAYMENNSSEFEEIEGDSGDEIKMILWDMAQSAYLKQSSRLAELIQNELNSFWRTRNRGIKQAPFKVLTGVACPAVLVEVAFISNPEEERKLVKESYQENIAKAIFQGLKGFLRSYSGG